MYIANKNNSGKNYLLSITKFIPTINTAPDDEKIRKNF